MEPLFTAELMVNGKQEMFTVTFHDEKYIFQSLSSIQQFSIRREEDEWHPTEPLSDQLKNAATEKLEAYLLSQH